MPLDFYIYYKDTPVAHVWIDKDSTIHHKAWECPIQFHIMPKCPPSIEYVMNFLESRCPDRNNGAIDVILKELGIPSYNPIDIIRKLHGVMFEDFFWVRFSDEPVYRWKELGHVRCTD